jgi:hypothetical protein
LPDVDAEVLHIRVAAPHLVQEVSVREDLPCVGHEQAQDVVFFWRQFYLDIANQNDAAHEID